MSKLDLFFACLGASLLLSGCFSNGIVNFTKVPSAISNQEDTKPTIIQTNSPREELLPTEAVPPSAMEKTEFAPTLEWWNEESKKSIEIGNKIVETIESYYRDKGVYPNTLNDLVPVYLSEVPTTITGHGFAFILHRSDYFTLKFPYTRRSNDKVQYACGYSAGPNIIGEWECTHLLDYPN